MTSANQRLFTQTNSGSIFNYKQNFDKPYDPMSSRFDYEALRAEEKKLQEAAAKAAKEKK